MKIEAEKKEDASITLQTTLSITLSLPVLSRSTTAFGLVPGVVLMSLNAHFFYHM